MNKKSTSPLVRRSLGEGGSAPARLPAREQFRSSLGEDGFFNLRVLVALVVAVTGVALTFFATSAPGQAKPGVHTDHDSSKSLKPPAATPLGGPVVVSIIPIRGPERAYQPGAGIADLDHGFAAGATRYLHDDGIIYNDTRACFLWSQDGTTTLFEPPHDLDTTRSVYFAHQITPDGNKVAGSVAFLNTRTTAPWIGERDAGLKYLPLLP